MTPENAKVLLPVICAFAEGKEIEWHDGLAWNVTKCADFSDPPDRYRIKRSPAYRPYNDTEMLEMLGKRIRPKYIPPGDVVCQRHLVSTIGYRRDAGTVIYFTGFKSDAYLDAKSLFNDWTFLDESPCGALVE